MKGRDIIRAVRGEHFINQEDLLKSRYPEHVKVRRIAIERLAAAGFSPAEIGRLMGCHASTAKYHLDREYRTRCNRRHMQKYYERRQMEAA